MLVRRASSIDGERFKTRAQMRETVLEYIESTTTASVVTAATLAPKPLMLGKSLMACPLKVGRIGAG